MKFAINKLLYALIAFAAVAAVLVMFILRELSNAKILTSGTIISSNNRIEISGISVLTILFFMIATSVFALSKIDRFRPPIIGSQMDNQALSDQDPVNTNEYHRMIAEIEDYAIILLDESGIIKNWNKGALKIKGYEAKEIIGKNFSVFYTSQDRQNGIPEKILSEARQKGKAVCEGLRIRKDGSAFWGSIVITALYDANGVINGFTKVTRDITEKRKVEEKFYALLDSAPDATVIVNEEGVIQMANTQTEKLFGYSRHEIIGKPVEVFIPIELRSRHIHHRADFARSSKVRAMGVGIELNAVKKDGSMFPVEISLSPIQTEEGMLISAAIRDITHRKELETELKKINTELEAFTYSVSHDLRAPLRGIIGFTNVLEEEYSSKLDNEAKRITSIIKANTIRMGRLIDDLLNFSRTGKQEIVKADFSTKAMVHEVINEITGQYEIEGIEWDIRELLPARGDISTIRQVWVNLISNAVKYSRNKPRPVIEIGSWLDNGFAVFYVKDNGVGFDEQYKDKLFRVFQRLHDADEFEGTGVGLAVVEKIISRHKGKVWAEGKMNEGAGFYFTIPV